MPRKYACHHVSQSMVRVGTTLPAVIRYRCERCGIILKGNVPADRVYDVATLPVVEAPAPPRSQPGLFDAKGDRPCPMN